MLFTTDDLASYLEEDVDLDRALLIQTLTVGLVYEVCPQQYADVSVEARAIGIEVAARALRNAGGYAQERIDDYSYMRPPSTQEAGVYLTEDERARLLWIASGKPRRRVRSVRLASWSVPQL